MGMEEMPLLAPVTLSVSASISCRTSSKFVNFFRLQCKNSAYSVRADGQRGEKVRQETEGETGKQKRAKKMHLTNVLRSCFNLSLNT